MGKIVVVVGGLVVVGIVVIVFASVLVVVWLVSVKVGCDDYGWGLMVIGLFVRLFVDGVYYVFLYVVVFWWFIVCGEFGIVFLGDIFFD